MADGISAYTATPRQTKIFVQDTLEAGLVPFVQSSPGMGKSAIIKQIAKEYNLKVIDHRLSTSAPEDLSGLPAFIDGKARFMPFDTFPTKNDPIPEGYDGWLLFLDEFNSASKAVQAAAYKLVLDKAVGQHDLHDSVAIVAAGNLSTDRAIVNPVGTAMQSRLVHIHMTLDQKEFIEDIVIGHDWDKRIGAYLNWKPSNIMDFRPDNNDKTFCCPRTWEFVNKLVKGKYKDFTTNAHGERVFPMMEKAALLAGTITSGVAAEFITFCKIWDKLPSIKQIVANPELCDIPVDGATRYATVTHCVEYTDEDNVADVLKYIDRFGIEFRIIYMRYIKLTKTNLLQHPAMVKGLVAINKYLND